MVLGHRIMELLVQVEIMNQLKLQFKKVVLQEEMDMDFLYRKQVGIILLSVHQT